MNAHLINSALDKIAETDEIECLEKLDIIPCHVRLMGDLLEVEYENATVVIPKPKKYYHCRLNFIDKASMRLVPPNILKYVFSFNKAENIEETLEILREYNLSA